MAAVERYFEATWAACQRIRSKEKHDEVRSSGDNGGERARRGALVRKPTFWLAVVRYRRRALLLHVLVDARRLERALLSALLRQRSRANVRKLRDGDEQREHNAQSLRPP